MQRQISLVLALLVAMLCTSVGCGLIGGMDSGQLSTNPITDESMEGLILEGEGPIPARLIYGSRNTISSEEDQLVLEEIMRELDKLVELAGRLDEAVLDEASITEAIAP